MIRKNVTIQGGDVQRLGNELKIFFFSLYLKSILKKYDNK